MKCNARVQTLQQPRGLVAADDADLAEQGYRRDQMGYALRESIPGCHYHAVTRGNNQRAIFTDGLTRLMFMVRLTITARRCGWTIVAYILMDNHYHLVLRVGDSGLSQGMKQLNGLYAMAFNHRVGRRDHLFGRRFWSRRIEDETDLVETCRYVDLNRSRVEFDACHPADWPWSGYRAAVGLEAAKPTHQPQDLWQCFHRQPRLAMDAYSAFVEDGLSGTGLTRTGPVSDTVVRPPGEPARRPVTSACTRGRCRLPEASSARPSR